MTARMRARFVLVLIMVATLLPSRSEALDAGVRIWNGKADATTEGTVLLGVSAHDLYAAATSYARWTDLFSDVTSVQVESGGHRDAVVRFSSRALGHTLTVRFDNAPHRLIRFTLVDGPPGTVASGSYLLDPDPRRRSTLVRAKLHADVTGIAGWFISSERVRRMRERKLRSDLSDLRRIFPTR